MSENKPLTFVLSDESINSRGFRILTAGIDLSLFKKNPIMLWNHHRAISGKVDDILPIGTWENIRKEGDKLLADAVFDEKDDFAQRIKGKVEAGVLRMASSSFRPIATSDDPAVIEKGQTLPTLIKCLLREVSICDIGSNYNSLKLTDEFGREINLSDGDESHLFPLLNTNKNNTEMNLQDLSAALGLKETATQEELLAEVQNLRAQNEALTAADAERRTDERNVLLNDAIKARKITEAQRSTYEKLYDADSDATIAALDAMEGVTELKSELAAGEFKEDPLEAAKKEVQENLKTK